MKPRQIEIRGQNTGEEKAEQRKNPGDQKSNNHCTYIRKSPVTRGKIHLKRVKETLPGAHAAPQVVSIPISHAGKTHNPQHNG